MPNPHPIVPAPAEPNNKRAVTHGAYSPSLVNLRSEELRPIVIAQAKWLAAPEFAGTVDLYCRTLAVALMGLEWIEQTTAEKGYAKVPPRLIETTARMTTTAARLGTLLGLDPRSKAVIQSLAASTETSLASLDRLSQTGRQIRQRRQAELKKNNDDHAT